MKSLFDLSRASNRLLILIIGADLFLIFIHILHGVELRTSFSIYELLADKVFSIQVDRSLGEAYMYVKEFWIGLMLLILAFRHREGLFVYGAWGLLFFYLLTDDMLSIHEELSYVITDAFQLQDMGMMSGRDLAELLFAGFKGGVSLLVFGLAYLKADAVRRLHTRYFLLLLLLLAFFGVGVDLLHMMFTDVGVITNALLAMVEDGGEMIVMSLIVWVVFQLFDQDEIPELSQIPWMKL